MKIINLLGEEIYLIDEGLKSPGKYEIAFDSSVFANRNFPSGIYFYQLEVNEKSFTKKMIYLK